MLRATDHNGGVTDGGGRGGGGVAVSKKMKSLSPFDPRFHATFVEGCADAFSGLKVAVTCKPVLTRYRKSILTLLVLLVATYLLAFVLFLPLRILLILLSVFIDIETYRALFSPSNIAYQLMFFLPVLAAPLRYFLPFFSQNVLFDALSVHHPELAHFLKNTKQRPFSEEVWLFVRRTVKLLAMGLVYFIFSLIPYIGRLANPIALFLTVRRPFGVKVALVVSLACVVPLCDRSALILIRVWWASKALGRELLQPYFARLNDSHSEYHVLTSHHALILGFAFPLTLLLAVPLFGPLMWGFAQAGTCVLLAKILALEATQAEEEELTPHRVTLLGQAHVSRQKTLD
eukprot:TRINITY_DN14619_c0_g1_i1.p1 TRINITY_DN14619_c0_g1~~TRINITY_DN14619_c0_g1_i1.p1  ORF type:complete len:345 (-),score=64.10 TRINITY_DN14619_c0_g1_i1:8-1042(-)